jgi:cytochrome c oxidase cbb3-type subunit 1
VATLVLLFHYVIVALNLRGGLGGGKGDAVLGFVSAGLLAYLIGGVLDAVFSFRIFAETVQFTYFPMAQLKLSLVGAYSFLAFGAIYYLAPRITGVAWPSTGLIRAHFGLALLGTVVTVASLGMAGLAQGRALNNPAASFAAIATATRPWLLAATAGEAILLLGTLVLTVHFLRLQAATICPTWSSTPAAVEASAS